MLTSLFDTVKSHFTVNIVRWANNTAVSISVRKLFFPHRSHVVNCSSLQVDKPLIAGPWSSVRTVGSASVCMYSTNSTSNSAFSTGLYRSRHPGVMIFLFLWRSNVLLWISYVDDASRMESRHGHVHLLHVPCKNVAQNAACKFVPSTILNRHDITATNRLQEHWP